MNEPILVVSHSDRTSLAIAKRLRQENVFSVLLPGSATAEQARALSPKGIVLSGQEAGTGVLDSGILELGVPVLALGHSAHMMLLAMGGACAGTGLLHRRVEVHFEPSALFEGLTDEERTIREAQTLMLPASVRMTASGGGCTLAFEDAARGLYGIQFELERGDPLTSAVLSRFLFDICGCEPWYTQEAAQREMETALAEQIATDDRVICAVTGGLDSTTTAALANRVAPDRLLAVYVETGLMRASEGETVRETFATMGIPLVVRDAREQAMTALRGLHAPQEKRRAVRRVLLSALAEERQTANEPILLGTDYVDRLYGTPVSALTPQGVRVLEPLSACFREEIAALAERLDVPEAVQGRKPFPPLGLGAFIMGEIREEKLSMLRAIDAIFREELRASGLIPKLYDFYPVLSEEGAFGGGRQVMLCAHTLSGGKLMPARLPHDLIERTVSRIMEDFPSVTRVMLDETPKNRSAV